MTRNNGKRKVGVVGVGLVGSSLVYALMIKELTSEIGLVDIDNERAIGEMMDFNSLRESQLAEGKVIGSGTILDTSRFRFFLGQYYRVDARSVHAYIIGEHGDSEIPVWSLANIGGVRLQEFAPLKNRRYEQADMDKLFAGVRDAAYEIIKQRKN